MSYFYKRNYIINGVVEKPSIKEAPSNNAVIGRYILPRTIFKKLKSLKPVKGTEIHITDAIQELINDIQIIFCLDFNNLSRINELGKLIEKSNCKLQCDAATMLKCRAEMKESTSRVQVKVPNCMHKTFLTKKTKIPNSTQQVMNIVSKSNPGSL